MGATLNTYSHRSGELSTLVTRYVHRGIGRWRRKFRQLLFILSCSVLIVGAVHAAQWAKTYGGTGDDYFSSMQRTTDGGYIVAGSTTSFGAGGFDAWLLKLDASGNVTWQKTYGHPPHDYDNGNDIANSVQPTPDGGYIVAGTTVGAGGHNYSYFWVMKLDASGNITWQNAYGGFFYSVAYSVQPTPDGGYIVAGRTNSYGPGDDSFWVLKLDATGSITWQKTYGGIQYGAYASAVLPTIDGGYIVAGSLNGAFGSGNAWLLKLDAGGNVIWQNIYGYSEGVASANSVQQTPDGGYIVAGTIGAVMRVWVVKLDASGNITWQKVYGNLDGHDDSASSVQPTADGGYVVVGYTTSLGASGFDAWLLKLDASGNLIWQRTYGSTGDDRASSVQPTADGGYIVAGQTTSFGAGGLDAWLLKLDANGAITGCANMGKANVIAGDTSAITVNSTAIVTTSNAIPISNAAITQGNSTAAALTQCYYDAAPVATNVPTLSEWGMVLMSGILGACGAVMMCRDRKHGVGSHNAG